MEYRPYYLAREWVKSGHKVTIVAANYSHIRQKNIQIEANNDYLHEDIDGIHYIWCKVPEYGKNGLKRVINIFSFLKKVRGLKNTLIDKKPDIVIASSTHPFDVKVAHDIAKNSKAKLVYEVHDLWPLTPMEVGGMSKWHPFIMAMQWAENHAYKIADKVVSLLPKARDYMETHGMQRDKFIYIPNGVVASDWLNATHKIPNEHQNLLSRLKDVENKFIIGYAGGMGEANALHYLLNAAKLLKNKPFSFILIGDGSQKAELKERILNEDISSVHILPAISKLQIPHFLSSCDALYIGWNNLPIYRFGICPNKLFDYMLSKKPIIHSVTAGNDLVDEARCGISVAAEDVKGIASAIEKVSELNSETRLNLGQNGYNFVLINHDYRILATRFLDNVLR